jgi:hypothetical protein
MTEILGQPHTVMVMLVGGTVLRKKSVKESLKIRLWIGTVEKDLIFLKTTNFPAISIYLNQSSSPTTKMSDMFRC